MCTVLDSWWWTEKLSETCRVLFQKWIWEISASRWFYYKNITMHSPLNVKFVLMHLGNDSPTTGTTTLLLTALNLCKVINSVHTVHLDLRKLHFLKIIWGHVKNNSRYKTGTIQEVVHNDPRVMRNQWGPVIPISLDPLRSSQLESNLQQMLTGNTISHPA